MAYGNMGKAEVRRARKRAFVQAYIAQFGFNGRAAAISVGVDPKSAAQQASAWLKSDDVVAMLNEEWEKLRIKHEMTLDVAIMQLGRIGTASIAHYLKRDAATGKVETDENGIVAFDFTATQNEQFDAVASIKITERVLRTNVRDEETTETVAQRTVELKMHDKVAALDKLVRILGGYEGKEAPIINDNRTQIVADQVTVTTQEDAADAYRRMING